MQILSRSYESRVWKKKLNEIRLQKRAMPHLKCSLQKGKLHLDMFQSATWLFVDAIKVGDSGMVILVLKVWVLAYRGNGRSKYAHEMLHLIHNLECVWSKELRHAIIGNWLLNPTGRPNAFIEIDLVQEHLNFWIKKIYKGDGDAHSWEWLALVSPCVDILRHLAGLIHEELGTAQGSRHTIPDLEKDLNTLMDSLKEHDVYIKKEGHVLDARNSPAGDVISEGLAALSQGSGTTPLADFNHLVGHLQSRRRLNPVLTGSLSHIGSSIVLDNMDFSQDLPADTESNGDEDEEEEEIDEDLFADSPTLMRLDEEDVALEMDEWDLDGQSDEEMSDEEDEVD
ncbi:hypothetical protein DXG01_004464 [Tephrocybe rancida]|nr:hypothetical protein DXG01_004464 [Tephrocybe rancida]